MDTDQLVRYLRHVEQEAAFLIDTAEDLDYETYVQDRITTRAFERSVMIIGEAVARIRPLIEDQYPDLPWREIVGMRNWLVHQYWAIDQEVVWNVVQQHLPSLRTRIRSILNDLGAR